jgi:hypothetical protein
MRYVEREMEGGSLAGWVGAAREPIDEEDAVRLALASALTRETGAPPTTALHRVQSLSIEEAYYWLARSFGPMQPRGRRALAHLLGLNGPSR